MAASRHSAPPSLTRTTKMVTPNPIMSTPSATMRSLDSQRPSSSVLMKQMSRAPSDQPTVDCSSEESLDARIERLGRQRPDNFQSLWAEIGFVFSICMSQVLSVKAPSPRFVLSLVLMKLRNTSCRDLPSLYQP